MAVREGGSFSWARGACDRTVFRAFPEHRTSAKKPVAGRAKLRLPVSDPLHILDAKNSLYSSICHHNADTGLDHHGRAKHVSNYVRGPCSTLSPIPVDIVSQGGTVAPHRFDHFQ
jgi:hypothetical protein